MEFEYVSVLVLAGVDDFELLVCKKKNSASVQGRRESLLVCNSTCVIEKLGSIRVI